MNLFEVTEIEVSQPNIHETAPAVSVDDRLADVLFKLRSFVEPTGGDYSMGFEEGLAMAAEMIENLINAIGDKSGS